MIEGFQVNLLIFASLTARPPAGAMLMDEVTQKWMPCYPILFLKKPYLEKESFINKKKMALQSDI